MTLKYELWKNLISLSVSMLPKKKYGMCYGTMRLTGNGPPPFCEGSYAETDNWKEGSKVLFLGPGRSGMVSTVAVNRPNEFMSFNHLGEVKDGIEDTTSEKVKQWAGATENYTLTEKNGVTELVIDIDINDDFKDYMMKSWPKALDLVKELSENKN